MDVFFDNGRQKNRDYKVSILGTIFIKKGVSPLALTEKQKRFADQYLIDLNATRAYLTAYKKVKEETAAANGSRLLRNANVAEYIQKRMKDRERRTEITQDMVLRELAKLGFYDARKLYGENGDPLRLSELDDNTAACIVGLKVREVRDQDGEPAGYEKEYKLADKKGALELIGRHLGMFKDKTELSGDLGLKITVDYGDGDAGG